MPRSHTEHQLIHLDKHWFTSENTLSRLLSRRAQPLLNPKSTNSYSQDLAQQWIRDTRQHAQHNLSIETLLATYSLSSEEGLRLLSLAEALLRIPDKKTADALIDSKLYGGHWQDQLKKSLSPWINTTTRALLFAEHIVAGAHTNSWLLQLESKLGKPILREALSKSISYLGQQFVIGETLPEAYNQANKILQRSPSLPLQFSFDMLGEAALCDNDVDRYFNAYEKAIIFSAAHQIDSFNPSVSIKLSALHPRFEWSKRKQVITELLPKLLHLSQLAHKGKVPITLDAEEANRLTLTLLLYQEVLIKKPQVDIGLAVQAYGKRAFSTLGWLLRVANKHRKRLSIRLVKGAYWDSEIKWAQQQGLTHYPVFTHKDHTDISYLACAQRLLSNPEAFYPQFATHNATTVARLWQYAKSLPTMENANIESPPPFEFQRLFGMGEQLYHSFYSDITNPKDDSDWLDKSLIPCRIYAPVGQQESLLPYLIRRLLENGASTSFVHHVTDENHPIEKLVAAPLCHTESILSSPTELFHPQRENSVGINTDVAYQEKQVSEFQPPDSVINSRPPPLASLDSADQLFNTAKCAFIDWGQTTVFTRAETLEDLANLFQENQQELAYLCALETGKTIKNGLDEIREAIDFCRYYASQAREKLQTTHLPSITGEQNSLSYQPLGTVVCISPWNFPVAIFTGQITAALVAGNCVIAKPAEQSPKTAEYVANLMYQAGIPKPALQLAFGEAKLGQALTSHPDTKAVLFTGSTDAAKDIQQRLATKSGPITPLIAETGGINTMICDSSALSDQVIHDVLTSAFDSAGQRCSALRILYLPDTVYYDWKERLLGAMEHLTLGDPIDINTDIGPLIDQDAFDKASAHLQQMQTKGLKVHQPRKSGVDTLTSTHFYPTLVELPSGRILANEVFAPILHLVPYKADDISTVLQEINCSGYGLTLGIHSRNHDWVSWIVSQVQVGNIYINRNMVGAVVGSQPFGGCGLSGTGPKAGGSQYLLRLTKEVCLSENTAAIGGNADLLTNTKLPNKE